MQNADGDGVRIAAIETFEVAYPVVGQFRFLPASGTQAAVRETVVIKVTDTDGVVGWGQSVPSPTWSYETIGTVRSTIEQHLAPALVRLNPFDTARIWSTMNRVIAPSFSTGQPICKAGIDLALFDLTGRRLQQTPAERWQRSGRAAVTLSWTVDVLEPGEVEATLADAAARGFRNFNVKVGRDLAVDIEVCRQIHRLAPHAFVWVDANGGYDVETALAAARQFADLGIAAFEQPLPANRLTGYRRLRQLGALPILMDEGIVSLVELQEFHQLGLLDGVAMKVSRSGGLTESRRLIEYLQSEGLLFYASGLTDPDLALVACLHLFAAYDLAYPAALNAPQLLGGSLLRSPLRVEGDQALVPVGAGLGVDVVEPLPRVLS